MTLEDLVEFLLPKAEMKLNGIEKCGDGDRTDAHSLRRGISEAKQLRSQSDSVRKTTASRVLILFGDGGLFN